MPLCPHAPLYVSDLDGTLLNREAQLSAFTRSALQQLLAAGLPLTIATSRSLASVQQIFRGVELPLPIIEVNGAYISDLKTGRHEAISTIAPEQLPRLLELVRAHDCSPLISSTDGQSDYLYCEALLNDGMAWYANSCEADRDPRWRNVADLGQVLTEQVVRFTLIQTEGCIKSVALAIQRSFDLNTHLFENPYQPGWFWLTVQSSRSTKGQAIATLRSLPQLRSLALDKRELVVFGDEHNDLDMFQRADRAIAPANAVLPIRQLAQEIIGPHGEDSVARYLLADWKKA